MTAKRASTAIALAVAMEASPLGAQSPPVGADASPEAPQNESHRDLESGDPDGLLEPNERRSEAFIQCKRSGGSEPAPPPSADAYPVVLRG